MGLVLICLIPEIQAKEPILDIQLTVYNNDTVEEKLIIVEIGKPTEYYQSEGDYTLSVLDEKDEVAWSQKLNIIFGYSGPVVFGENYTGIAYDSYFLSFRVPYDSGMKKISLTHNENIIFLKTLENPCNENNVCEPELGENTEGCPADCPISLCGNGKCDAEEESYSNCPEDCPSGSSDGYCDRQSDSICDPDCTPETDPDCKKVEGGLEDIWLIVIASILPIIALIILIVFSYRKKGKMRDEWEELHGKWG